jgi:hypothetical protein
MVLIRMCPSYPSERICSDVSAVHRSMSTTLTLSSFLTACTKTCVCITTGRQVDGVTRMCTLTQRLLPMDQLRHRSPLRRGPLPPEAAQRQVQVHGSAVRHPGISSG